MIKINKHEIIKYGLIASLLANFTIGGRYVVDSKEYKGKIKHLTSEVKSLDNDKQFLLIEFGKRIKNIKELQEKVDSLANENNVIRNELNKSKEENKKLKKQFEVRKEMNKKRKFYVEATAYTAMCQEGCTGITFTEVDIRNSIYHKGYRVIASDNSVLPLYSIVQVDTKNESFKAIVLDRGGGIDNFEIDLLVRNETDATNFGRQRALITVLKEGNS